LSRSLTRAAPVRFLIGVAAVWTMARGVALVGWGPPPAIPQAPRTRPARSPATPPLLTARVAPFAFGFISPPTAPLLRTAYGGSIAIDPPETWRSATEPLLSPDDEGYRVGQLLMLAYSAGSGRTYRRSGGLGEAATTAGPPSDKHWSGSAWAFLRGGGRATALSPGQVGGGQAGARILYEIDKHLSAAARISTAIGGARQTEAAFGLDWKPTATLPVHLMAERRVVIDRGGRNAWTLGAAGGIDDVRIAPGWRLDAYGEAGVVGAHRRDLYADGAARIARAIDLGAGKSLAMGGGAWGAAQPGASRLDLGPSVVLRLPVEHRTVAIALDWRERVLGSAKPGSGIALTVATDF